MTRYTKRRHARRALLGERCEPRYCLSGVAFSTHEIIANDAFGLSSVHAADLDGDDDLDVLSASLDDKKIAWYENTDGNGSFGLQQVIVSYEDFAWYEDSAASVYAEDLDGDGDLDAISASFGDGRAQSPGTKTRTAKAASGRSR